MNIKKEVNKLHYDLVKIVYTNESTGQSETVTIECEPKHIKNALKRFDLVLMKRFKDENNPS